MKKSELMFEYPEDLVATQPQRPSRILWTGSDGEAAEIQMPELIRRFRSGDVLLINDTKVEPRRVIAKNVNGEDIEILFVRDLGNCEWEILAPTRLFKAQAAALPQGITAQILQTGRPQRLKLSQQIDFAYFEKFGQMPLPPYIQKTREKETGQRLAVEEDQFWYQTDWAQVSGSSAAPTASLHFTQQDLADFRTQGVQVCPLTLHVGLGTYLPLTVEDLKDHEMHRESVQIPKTTLLAVQEAIAKGNRVWAMGTTAARSIEAWAQGHLHENSEGAIGETDLLIQVGYEWRVVRGLLTNFHQPESTLLALVCGFAGRDKVFEVYRRAIERRFRLFSYGDLTAWERS